MSLLWRRYFADQRGNFAVIFAIMGVPLVVATTFIIDYAGAGTEKVNVKTALDAAVIAAVNNNSLTLSEKETYAATHFNQNYNGPIALKLKSKATGNRVQMSASGVASVTVAATLGIDGIGIFERSAAEIASENVICVLALASDMDEAITFEQGATFRAPSCSVHANSTSSKAIVTSGDIPPFAKSFCTAGGAIGAFSPYAKGDCSTVADPYKHVKLPLPGPCISGTSLKNLGKKGGFIIDGTTRVNVARTVNDTESDNSTGDYVTLFPGTYCGGLKVDGVGVTFQPGEYIMLEGELNFKNTAVAKGEGVTFILQGENTKLKIEKGASLYLKAPSQGPLAGLAFVQKPFVQFGKKKPKLGKNEIKSGGRMQILGTLYFPKNTLKISGNDSSVGAQSPATSFIAYDIHFGKNEEDQSKITTGGEILVAIDHVAAGLPPILPRIEDGARLVE